MTEQERQQRFKGSMTRARGGAVLALHRAINLLDADDELRTEDGNQTVPIRNLQSDDCKTAAIREILWAIDCLDGHRPLRYSENAKWLPKVTR